MKIRKVRRTIHVPEGIKEWQVYVSSTGEMLSCPDPVALINHMLRQAVMPFPNITVPQHETMVQFKLVAVHETNG